MADDADRAYEHQEMLTRIAIADAKRRLPSNSRRGRCVYCSEPCANDAVLHIYCREDYDQEQHVRRINGEAT